MTKTLYRYDAESDGRITLNTFWVTRETPCGHWIDVWGKRKFVLSNGRKRFAYETKELALESLVARKTRQTRILSAQLENARSVLARAASATPETLDCAPSYYRLDL